jgi:hypothetical protein
MLRIFQESSSPGHRDCSRSFHFGRCCLSSWRRIVSGGAPLVSHGSRTHHPWETYCPTRFVGPALTAELVVDAVGVFSSLYMLSRLLPPQSVSVSPPQGMPHSDWSCTDLLLASSDSPHQHSVAGHSVIMQSRPTLWRSTHSTQGPCSCCQRIA